MTFFDAVKVCLTERYFTFSGRASRSEYWYFMLFYLLLLAVPMAVFIPMMVMTSAPDGTVDQTIMIVFVLVCALFSIGLMIPAMTAAIRRFHDSDLSGWTYFGISLATCIPIIGFVFTIVMIWFLIRRGTPGENQYGPDPVARPDISAMFAEKESDQAGWA